MARIKTERPEAARYNGVEAAFGRHVTEADGPAYDRNVDQVIVKIGGEELYFFANEVTLSEAEQKAADKTRQKTQKEAEEVKADAAERFQNKVESLSQFKAGAKPDDQNKPIATTGGIAPMDAPAHQGVSAKTVAEGTSPFNRVPGEPQRTAEQDGGASNVGPGGYPEGSGPDPQGRRVNEKDQSKSNPSERPVPGAQAPQE